MSDSEFSADLVVELVPLPISSSLFVIEFSDNLVADLVYWKAAIESFGSKVVNWEFL